MRWKMQRNKIHDGIFLHNFFKDHLEFFTWDQPPSYDTFWWNFCSVTDEWEPLRQQIDSYTQITPLMKKELELLFELADEFLCLISEDNPRDTTILEMRKLWTKIRTLAISIRLSAKSQKLYTEGLYSGPVKFEGDWTTGSIPLF